MTRTEATALFIKNLQSNGVQAFHAKDRGELQALVSQLSAECSPVYCPRMTEVEKSLDIPEALITSDYAGAGVTVEEMPAAVAETGSIISWSANGTVLPANLLPPRHIALVCSANIFTDLTEFFASLRGTPPTNITFITGPSRTADIEQTLITGVHGPQRLDVVVFE